MKEIISILAVVSVFLFAALAQGDYICRDSSIYSNSSLCSDKSNQVFSNIIVISENSQNTNKQDNAVTNIDKTNDVPSNIEIVENIVNEYHKIHTYSESDFFVCADMAIDVWNQVKSKGINAKICAGNIDKDILKDSESLREYLSKQNHAWVLAETSPFKWVALETTGGYLVWGESIEDESLVKNDLYYGGFCFYNPKEFKKCIDLRRNYLKTCNEADRLRDYWNSNYVGKYNTFEISEFKGRMNSKIEECNNLENQLTGLIY